jgi:hypothetical protein
MTDATAAKSSSRRKTEGFHLERGLRFHIESEYKRLYGWAIQEIDAQGKQIGGDQIPWSWTLYFTGTSCGLADSVEIESQRQKDGAAPAAPIEQRQHISVRLRPSRPFEDGDPSRQTTFSMFGTDRVIKNFDLDIYPIVDPTKEESCSAWGSVSQTTEIDFRHVTLNDVVGFHLFVKPDTFARYAAKVAHGLVDDIFFSVGWVDGFYSEWSPSISTRNVKVLTEDSEQNITLPLDHKREPPRLGHVGKATLHINRRLEFSNRVPKPEAVGEMPDFATERTVPDKQAPAAVDPRMLQMLGSLKQAAWLVVCLLAVIFIVTLLKR